jgi:uncharacterized protein (TIGR03663 family)
MRSEHPHTGNIQRDSLHITPEMVAWAAVVVLAIVLRMTELGKAPLSSREAGTALLAWRATTGETVAADRYSPVLLAATAGLFTVTGSSDALARFWPALAGTALCLTPVLLRRHLGVLGGLAAGACLAFSPTAMVASRQLDPTIVSALGVAVCLGCVVRFLDSRDRRWLWLAAGALGLALAAGAPAFGLLVPLLAGVGAMLGLGWTRRASETVQVVSHRHGRETGLVFVISLAMLSTGLGWNPSGLGALAESPLVWLAGTGYPQHTVYPLGLLVLYEPLVLVAAVLGLTYLLRQQRTLGALLGAWAATALLLLWVLPQRAPLDVLSVVLPGALLAGAGIGHLAEGVRQQGVWHNVRFYVPVVVLLWTYFVLMLGRYGAQAQEVDLLLAMLAFLMQALLLALFALVTSGDLALHALAVGGGLLLLAYTVSAGWGAAHMRPTDPSELLMDQPTAEEVRSLVQSLRELSWEETGMPTTLAFAYDIRSDPVLTWYLREFAEAQPADLSARGKASLPVLVTLGGDVDLADSQLVGQDFALRRHWTPAELDCRWTWPVQCSAGVRWWLLRRTPASPAITDQATIWVTKADEALTEP